MLNCRALDLAVKHDSNIDVVVAYRRKYLEQFGWTETIPRFVEVAKKVVYTVYKYIFKIGALAL